MGLEVQPRRETRNGTSDGPARSHSSRVPFGAVKNSNGVYAFFLRKDGRREAPSTTDDSDAAVQRKTATHEERRM